MVKYVLIWNGCPHRRFDDQAEAESYFWSMKRWISGTDTMYLVTVRDGQACEVVR